VAPEPSPDALVADLRALRAVDVTPAEVDAVVAGVAARLAAAASPPAPGRAPWRARTGEWVARRRRRLAVACVVVVLALTGVPAVRAAVADWFGFAGVRVRLAPSPVPASSAPVEPPPAASGVSLAEARGLVRFTLLAPAALGPPSGVEVSVDRRVVSMSWTVPDVGVVRVDQFDGGLDYAFSKTAEGVTYTTVNGDFAMWFDRPHALTWLAGGGPQTRTQPARLAARTLVWQAGGTALRLEGDLSLDRARAIADSVR
jgi:hypothetical protein